ncbi:response regulator [bacterium]|nr:response regulator [bacterium]
MAIDIKRFVARFVEEAREHIGHLEDGVARFSSGSFEPENINQIFRSAHTVKGSSRMLKLLTISETAHKLEDVIGALRDQNLEFSPELGRLLLRAIDAIAALVDIAEKNEPLPEVDASLCELLAQAAQGSLQTVTVATATSTEPKVKPDINSVDKTDKSDKTKAGDVLKSSDTVRISISRLDELVKLMDEVLSSHTLSEQRLLDLKALELQVNAKPDISSSEIQARLRTFGKNLRDDVTSRHLLMKELYDKALIMRMLPLSIVFDPAARLIRELARSVGKEAECIIEGGEIELDRQMIDKLSDPVVHLLRNAIDHGIEPANERQAAGKSLVGEIRLSARQEGGWVVIEICDNGSGLPLESIRQKAIVKKLFSPAEAAALSEKEVTDLIFLPGFSTNAIITDISGRGVGLDVVKKTIVEDLQGVIEINSNSKGTTFSLKLPLSLAIMQVLLCEVGGLTFGFTTQYVVKLLRVEERQLKQLAQSQAVVIGSEFIPVIALAGVLGLESKMKKSEELLLLVVKTHNKKLALIIDELVDEHNMVIKPLPNHLHNLSLVTGMVMTGKRELVSILNVVQLMKAASSVRNMVATQTGAATRQPATQHILVIDDSLNTREIEKDVLEANGYQVTTAEDGIDGWNKASAEKFDAILTDVEMPGMDGFSLTKRLRQEEKFKHIPIIIVTSREKEEDKLKGIEVGADAYIVKGDFEQSNLVETLRNLLG